MDGNAAVAAAREVFRIHGRESDLEHESPEDFNHFGPSMQQIVLEWLDRHVRK